MRIQAAVLTVASLMLAGCGGGGPRSGVLQSITVVPTTGASSTEFTATGHYSTAPTTMTNIPVAWFQVEAIVDPTGPNWRYLMTSAPFPGTCYPSSQPYTNYIIAYAPANPNAPAKGTMPFAVFDTLVEFHTVRHLDGFIAGVATLSCP
jgi:hypothetical protein